VVEAIARRPDFGSAVVLTDGSSASEGMIVSEIATWAGKRYLVALRSRPFPGSFQNLSNHSKRQQCDTREFAVGTPASLRPSAMAAAIQRLVDDGVWEGTSTQLLASLNTPGVA
jgi:hypothetical protein